MAFDQNILEQFARNFEQEFAGGVPENDPEFLRQQGFKNAFAGGGLVSGLLSWPEAGEELIVKPLDKALADAGIAEETRKRVTAFLKFPDAPGLLRTILPFVMLGVLGPGILRSITGTLGEVLGRPAVEAFRPGIATPDVLTRAGWRSARYGQLIRGNDVNTSSIVTAREAAREALSDQWGLVGLPDSVRDQILSSSTALLSPDQYFGLMQRGYLDHEEAIRQAAKTGADPEAIAALFAGSHPRLGLANVQEADRRGFITEITQAIDAYENEGLASERPKSIAQKLRFNVPTLFDLRQAYLRGWYKPEEFALAMEAAGYGDPIHEKIKAKLGQRQSPLGPQDFTRGWLAANTWLLPTPTDMVQFAVKEAFDEEVVRLFQNDAEYPGDARGTMNPAIVNQFDSISPKIASAKNQGQFFRALHEAIGMPDAIMRFQWRQHWRLPAPGMVYDMFFRGFVDQRTVEQYLKAQDYAPFWREKLLQIQRPLIARRPLSQALRQGVIDEAEHAERLSKLGYDDESARILTETGVRMAFWTHRERARERILSSFRQDEITREQTAVLLGRLGFGGDQSNFFIADSLMTKQSDKRLAELKGEIAESSEARDLTKSEILNAFEASIIDRAQARAMLVRIGFGESTADVLIEREVLSRLISDRRRIMNLIRDRFFAEQLDPGRAREELAAVGLEGKEINRLVSTWTLERSHRRALDTVRDKGPTKSEIGRWLKDGIISERVARGELERAGYTPFVVDNLIEEAITAKG